MMRYDRLHRISNCNTSKQTGAQVGMDGYMNQARLEARTYISQLQRVYGVPPIGSHFKIIRCPHDFSTYLDIRFYYNDEDQRHVAYMDNIEMGCLHWDDVAFLELEKARAFKDDENTTFIFQLNSNIFCLHNNLKIHIQCLKVLPAASNFVGFSIP